MARHANILESDSNVFRGAINHTHAFVIYHAVVRAPLQSIAEHIRRSHHIMQQPDLAKIKSLRKMKSEEFVTKRLGSQVQKFDLARHLQPSLWVINLDTGQTGLVKQSAGLYSRTFTFRIGKARNPANGRRKLRQPI